MNTLYTVSVKGKEEKKATLMSKEQAFLESRGSLYETIVNENVLDDKKVISSREVILKVVAFVQCDNCKGTGTTDALGTYSCSLCDGSGLVPA